MDKMIEKLLVAADNHGADAGAYDHTVGDLQNLLRRAWSMMSVSQRRQFLQSQEVADLVTDGGLPEGEASNLTAEIKRQIAKMEEAVRAASYVFKEYEGGFFWETVEESSEDFRDRDDAVVDAYKRWRETQAS